MQAAQRRPHLVITGSLQALFDVEGSARKRKTKENILPHSFILSIWTFCVNPNKDALGLPYLPVSCKTYFPLLCRSSRAQITLYSGGRLHHGHRDDTIPITSIPGRTYIEQVAYLRCRPELEHKEIKSLDISSSPWITCRYMHIFSRTRLWIPTHCSRYANPCSFRNPEETFRPQKQVLSYALSAKRKRAHPVCISRKRTSTHVLVEDHIPSLFQSALVL